LDVDGVASPPLPGVANHVWFLGQRLVLRIAGHDPASVAALHKEAAILPLAHQAGVRTAKLVAFDPDNALLGAPYMLLERVPGTNLGTLGLAPHATPEVYQALGHDLARWHARPIGPADPLGFVDHDPDPNPDPRPTVERLTTSGHLSTELERWLIRWLDRLAPAGRTPAQPRVLHGDAAPTNVLVTQATHRYAYAAVIDWGDAAWSDPAADLAKVPLRAVPAALEGYRRVGTGEAAVVTEARVLWFHLSWALSALGRSPRPREATWTAPPAGRILEILRFFLAPPTPAWSALGPDRPPA
jgi:hygromycin-B 7''-O-kinase